MPLYAVRAIYLGNEPMGELLDGENGSDAVQVPLKRTILRTDGVGDEVDVIITDDSLCVKYLTSSNIENKGKLIHLPIETLAYCGALRQLPPDRVKDREFETLDKTTANITESTSKMQTDPPLFVTIFRSLENENTLLCHSFVIRKDLEAMELVKNVMQVYYNIIEQLEQNEAANNLVNSTAGNSSYLKAPSNVPISTQQQQFKLNSDSAQSLTNFLKSKSHTGVIPSGVNLTQSELDRLLETYNRTGLHTISASEVPPYATTTTSIANGHYTPVTQSILNNHGFSEFHGHDQHQQRPSSIVSNEMINEAQYNNLIKDAVHGNSADYSNIPLNQDDDPLIIKKKNDEKVVYKQNVYIRWLQPPTPPPPAPIIIREVQEPAEQLPPVVIYKQAPRAITPPPLVIREKPPTPMNATEPIIIERRVPAIEQKRRVIVEEMPAPPAKPRDIILEKWLPRDKIKRSVIVEKIRDQTHHHRHHVHQQPPVYEYVETLKPVVYQQHSRNYSKYDDYVDRKIRHSSHAAPVYDIISDRTSRPAKRVVKQVLRPSGRSDHNYEYSNYHRSDAIVPLVTSGSGSASGKANNYVYTSHNQNINQHGGKAQLAGYRIIRQIIPGPNATQADIQKAIIRSQNLGEQSAYSKYFDPRQQQQQQQYYNGSNKYSGGVYSSSSGRRHHQYQQYQQPITIDSVYVPHHKVASSRNHSSYHTSYTKSNSIDM